MISIWYSILVMGVVGIGKIEWLFLSLFLIFCVLFCCAVQLQIEEITRRLRSGELGIPSNPADRSAPVPYYTITVITTSAIIRGVPYCFPCYLFVCLFANFKQIKFLKI